MKYIQVQSSTTWFKRMFLYGNLSTKIRRHLQYSLTIYGGHILQIIALSINISLYWTKIFEEFIKYIFLQEGEEWEKNQSIWRRIFSWIVNIFFPCKKKEN